MSIFGCLVDCARFDSVSECTSLVFEGHGHHHTLSPSHKDDVACGDRRNGRTCGGSTSSTTDGSEAEQEDIGDVHFNRDPDATQGESETPDFRPMPPTPNPSVPRRDNSSGYVSSTGDYGPVDRSSLPTLRSVQGARNRPHSLKRQSSKSRSKSGADSRAGSTSSSSKGSKSRRESSAQNSGRPSGGGAANVGRRGGSIEDSHGQPETCGKDQTGEGSTTQKAAGDCETGAFSTPARPPRSARRHPIRSSSMGMVMHDSYRRDRDNAFMSVPGTRDLRPASTPGRPGTRGTKLMARRVVAKWDDQDERGNPLETPERPRRLISTSVRRLRMSEDGSTVRVTTEKGDVDHELALADLLEVHGTPSRKRVVLRGKDLELQIAFDGENMAFNQFRDTLVVPDNIAETETETETDPDVVENMDECVPFPDGDPGMTESASSESQSGASSERTDDDVSSVGTHLTPRSSFASPNSPSGASCISEAMSQFPPRANSRSELRVSRDSSANGMERLLPSPSTVAQRYYSKDGSSSSNDLQMRRVSYGHGAHHDAPEETELPAPETVAPTADSIRVSRVGSSNTASVPKPEVGGVVHRMAARLSMKAADRMHEPQHERPGNVQNAGLVYQ